MVELFAGNEARLLAEKFKTKEDLISAFSLVCHMAASYPNEHIVEQIRYADFYYAEYGKIEPNPTIDRERYLNPPRNND